MSAYDNDPRVTARPDGTFEVDDHGMVRHVCPGQFGGWVAHSLGVDDVDGAGFGTSDETIRSLIEDPK